jgi:hypothetical protein
MKRKRSAIKYQFYSEQVSQLQNKKTPSWGYKKEFIENGDMNAFHEITAPDFISRATPAGVAKGPEGDVFL